jgi:hypothetical protein
MIQDSVWIVKGEIEEHMRAVFRDSVSRVLWRPLARERHSTPGHRICGCAIGNVNDALTKSIELAFGMLIENADRRFFFVRRIAPFNLANL